MSDESKPPRAKSDAKTSIGKKIAHAQRVSVSRYRKDPVTLPKPDWEKDEEEGGEE